MDVMRDLAHRLPVIVICDMLGIPEDHRAPFLAGSNVNGRILEPVPMTREELDQANRNTQMAGVYFDQLCELRRREPRTISRPSWCGPRRRATSSPPRSCRPISACCSAPVTRPPPT